MTDKTLKLIRRALAFYANTNSYQERVQSSVPTRVGRRVNNATVARPVLVDEGSLARLALSALKEETMKITRKHDGWSAAEQMARDMAGEIEG